jgi:hypothetical protein
MGGWGDKQKTAVRVDGTANKKSCKGVVGATKQKSYKG